MRLQVQVTIDPEDGTPPQVTEVAAVDRADLSPATLGLTLAEAKQVLSGVQQIFVTAQVTDYTMAQQTCPHCAQPYNHKGRHHLVMRTLFGKLRLPSPRFYPCACGATPSSGKSFSPLATLLPERTTPEFVYLQTKWTSVLSYGSTAHLLAEVFPLDTRISTGSLTLQVQKVAERLETELGAEQATFIEGCPRDWAALPDPAPPLTVGLDGGYVHGRDATNRKAGAFEVIVGKCLTEGQPAKRVGLVQGYDAKPKRRVFEMLRKQGMAANQQVTFLSDGGETVRDLPLYLNPHSEHVLDWFHITMRLTVLGQQTKGVPARPAMDSPTRPQGEEDDAEEDGAEDSAHDRRADCGSTGTGEVVPVAWQQLQCVGRTGWVGIRSGGGSRARRDLGEAGEGRARVP